MAGQSRAKRKIRKIKAQSEEARGVLDACMLIASSHGRIVNFPYELPQLLEELFSAQKAGGGYIPGAQANAAYNRLEALTSQNGAPQQHTVPVQTVVSPQPAAPAYQAPPPLPLAYGAEPWGAPAEATPPANPWATAANAATEEMRRNPTAVAQSAVAQSPPQDPTPITPQAPQPGMDQMMAKFEAGQARMVQRVAETGVQYKHGAGGPAAGQHLVTQNPVPVTTQVAPQPALQPAGRDGERRLKNGMSRSAALDAIERSTGTRPGTPTASPHAKPLG